MKNRLVTTLALTAALAQLALAQDDPGRQPAGGRGGQDVAATPEVLALAEENLELTIWKPEHASARQILAYVKDLTDRHVEFYVRDPLTGRFDAKRQRRDRFIQIEDAIGIQDFAGGRTRALRLLENLDDRIGELSAAPAQAREEVLTRTVRPRSMGVDAAVMLLSEMGFEIRMHIVRPTGTLVLNGPTSDVARAESLLMEVDQPVPQMTLHCTLIEAASSSEAAGVAALDPELARGLSTLMPDRHFREVGRLMLRAAAGGGAEFEASSGIGGIESPEADRPARFKLSAVSQGWDAERGVLNLGSCRFLLERPTFQVIKASSAGVQRSFDGYQQEGLSTNLALRAGEQTVVGSLGSDPVYIVLSYKIE